MSSSVLREYVRQLLESHRAASVTVSWQGGEPTLMGLEFCRQGMALVDELARPGQQVEHTMQTNATLIDDEWARAVADARSAVERADHGSPRERKARRGGLSVPS